MCGKRFHETSRRRTTHITWPTEDMRCKTKYHLRTLTKQGHLFGKIFGSMSTVGSIIAIIITIYIVTRCLVKKRRKPNETAATWSSATRADPSQVNLIISSNREEETKTPSTSEGSTSFQLRALTSGKKKY